MSRYKCTNSFTDSKGKRHDYGDKLDSYDYDRLSYREQDNYKKEDEGYGFGSHSPNIGDMLGTGLPGGIDLDFTTPL